jgi:hypothetical protein
MVKAYRHEGFLDFPDVLLWSDRELEILLGQTVVVLVDHHDGQQSTEGPEKDSVNVVFWFVSPALMNRWEWLTNCITDPDTEGKEEDDTNSVKTHTKEQISNDPSIV